ncbi:hypothetical protein TJA_20170 [Thermus sp. LT1-2-5]|uniref:hypothetical protein n=1 Tax=Thermus sp. LT1-2-5 TaxID=3026935 RepID=UPI0030E84705
MWSLVAPRPKDTEKVARLGYAILASGSPRKSDEEANHKAMERLRPQAERTPYGGRLRDGGRGFWVFPLAQPYKGRAIPARVGLFSQTALAAEGTSHPVERQGEGAGGGRGGAADSLAA